MEVKVERIEIERPPDSLESGDWIDMWYGDKWHPGVVVFKGSLRLVAMVDGGWNEADDLCPGKWRMFKGTITVK
jgi:hypothetical protein